MRPMFNSTEKQEREYLKKIRSIIGAGIDSTGESVADHVQTLKEYKKYLWNNKDIDAQEKRSMRESILNLLAVGNNRIAARGRHGKSSTIRLISAGLILPRTARRILTAR